MRHFLAYLLIFLFGFFMAKFWYQPKELNHQKEEIQVVLNSVENLSKLVVSKANFSEIYNYSDSKKYFYDCISFDKKAIVSVNAAVEVGYDLSKLEIQIDSIEKKIFISKIPEQEVVISPNIKYFDLQQSTFNSFSKQELNKMNTQSIDKIRNSTIVENLKEKSKDRLLEELSKIYQLSAIYDWKVIDQTNSILLRNIKY